MPHAFVEIKCSCNENKKYHCFSHDEDANLEEFNCHHFRCIVSKKARYGLLLGFDQLAGLYFDIICINCGKNKKYSYEAKTFGKENKEYTFSCCNNNLIFHSTWEN